MAKKKKEETKVEAKVDTKALSRESSLHFIFNVHNAKVIGKLDIANNKIEGIVNKEDKEYTFRTTLDEVKL